jgi:hypothetical protein
MEGNRLLQPHVVFLVLAGDVGGTNSGLAA